MEKKYAKKTGQIIRGGGEVREKSMGKKGTGKKSKGKRHLTSADVTSDHVQWSDPSHDPPQMLTELSPYTTHISIGFWTYSDTCGTCCFSFYYVSEAFMQQSNNTCNCMVSVSTTYLVAVYMYRWDIPYCLLDIHVGND